jgi:hypothetical protein
MEETLTVAEEEDSDFLSCAFLVILFLEFALNLVVVHLACVLLFICITSAWFPLSCFLVGIKVIGC